MQESVKMNKKAMSIPIVLLVILTLILITVSLFYFNIKQKNVKETITIPNEIDRVYASELQLNYHLQEIFDNATRNFKFEDGKQKFIDDFKIRLEKYDFIENKEEIKLQIVDENIELILDKITLTLNIGLSKKQEVDGKEIINIEHNYEKSFEKDL